MHDRDAALRDAPTWLAMGFRPFFLGAAVFATLTSTQWIHVLAVGRAPLPTLPAPLWHAHEMVFGFTMAVVAGFLLTAARNWTGLDTAHGRGLLGLAALWAAGRVGASGLLPIPLVGSAALSVAFPLLLAGVVGRVLYLSGSRRNYGVVVVLGGLALASAAVWAEALGLAAGLARPALYAALHGMVLLIVVIGGRVVPLFTRNRVGDTAIGNVPTVDRAALAAASAVALFAGPAAAGLPGAPTALALSAAVSAPLQLWRMRTWGTRRAAPIPMVAVLHAGYAWIGVGHALLAAALLVPSLSPTVALHALTLGAIGTMTLGMMARVTLGHTGRTIEDHPLTTYAFALMQLAAFARLAAFVVPSWVLVWTWWAAGAAWVAAFALYLARSGRALLSPRPDGRAG